MTEISSFTIKFPRPKGFEPNPKRVNYYFLHRVMWCLFPPDKWLHRWLRDNGGKVQLENETWVVHQSDDFHKYCYGKAYKGYSNAT